MKDLDSLEAAYRHTRFLQLALYREQTLAYVNTMQVSFNPPKSVYFSLQERPN